METIFRILSREHLHNHQVPGTEELNLEYIVSVNREEILRNSVTAKINEHGVFPDLDTINDQIHDDGLRSQVIVLIKEYLRGLQA